MNRFHRLPLFAPLAAGAGAFLSTWSAFGVPLSSAALSALIVSIAPPRLPPVCLPHTPRFYRMDAALDTLQNDLRKTAKHADMQAFLRSPGTASPPCAPRPPRCCSDRTNTCRLSNCSARWIAGTASSLPIGP